MTLTVLTGATGQVGLHLVDELIARGRRVRAVVLEGDDGLADRDVEVVRGDVRDERCLREAFAGADSVLHLAAIVSTESVAPPALFPVNVGGARNAARAAREAGVRRFVHFSSMVVFDPLPVDVPLDERRARATNGVSPYTRSKLLGEVAVRAEVEKGLDAVVVHPTVIVGPNETHHDGIVQGLLRQALRGHPPPRWSRAASTSSTCSTSSAAPCSPRPRAARARATSSAAASTRCPSWPSSAPRSRARRRRACASPWRSRGASSRSPRWARAS
ncbi:MAG: NAD-dependent epimerase/dehydratase family protein [Sandaracinaceae bacterium]|nr:NAD-dependent epimerase/dehydratase family protein [Sandaracinaceae bacterium]